MTPEEHKTPHPEQRKNRLQTGAQLKKWRLRLGLSAKELGRLLGVTERSVHRAESSAKIGARIRVSIQLLEAKGEIAPLGEEESLQYRAASSEPTLIVREPAPRYDAGWHGEMRSGADIKAWRRSIGLYQKELAGLLDVGVSTLIRAEQSQAPNTAILYGAELVRAKLKLGELSLGNITAGRPTRGRPKKRGIK